jgi:hypothetical protein
VAAHTRQQLAHRLHSAAIPLITFHAIAFQAAIMPPPPPPSKSYLLVLETDTEDEEEEEERRRNAIPPASYEKPTVTPVLTPSMQNPTPISPVTNEKHTVTPATQSMQDPILIPPATNEKHTVTPVTPSMQDPNPISACSTDEDDDDDEEDDDDDQTSSERAASSPTTKKKRRRKRNRKKKTPMTKNVTFDTVQVRLVERTLSGDGVPCDGGWPLGLSTTIVEDQDPIPVEDFDEHKKELLRMRWKAHYSGQKPTSVLETRQWDYKKDRDAKGNSVRNPLFGSLSEDQRHNLLVHGKAIKSPAAPKKGTLRPRSHSIDNDSGPFDAIHVRHVRKELEDLRNERSKDEGCACHKLHIPPKMSIRQVKEELRKRHALPAVDTTKQELEQLLYTIAQNEACCSSNDCPCFKNGINCQADACSCWNHSNEKPQTVKEINERCGNKNGMYAVDFKQIGKYRKEMMCQVIARDKK